MSGAVKDLGPCRVLYNSVDLGATRGGVVFRYTEESRPVVEDQGGVTPLDEIMVGSMTEVEMTLTRAALGKLAQIIGSASYSGALLAVSNNTVGLSMYDNAQALVIKPIVSGVASADTGTWLTCLKAYPRVDMEVQYDNENQRLYKVIFKCFPDASTGNRIWKIGA